MSDEFKSARNAFKTAKRVVQLLNMIALLVILLVGYVATGGRGVGGFLRIPGFG